MYKRQLFANEPGVLADVAQLLPDVAELLADVAQLLADVAELLADEPSLLALRPHRSGAPFLCSVQQVMPCALCDSGRGPHTPGTHVV